MKVLVSDSISPKGIEILKKAGLEGDVKTGLKPEELKKEISKYNALIVRSATKVTSDIISAAENLKVIGRAGSGLDNVDKDAATKRGIVVMNTPGGNTITTAEHTIALLVSMARQIPQATASMKAGRWEKKKFMGVELDELIKKSDFITIHTPLTKETKGLINAERIAQMKKEVRLINSARGGIVDEKALYDALKSGKVAAAALDVFEKEPPEGSPLLELEIG